MADKLKVNVAVFDEETNAYVTLQAGETVPAKYRSLITNPDVWASDSESDDLGQVPGSAVFADPTPAPLQEPTIEKPKSATKAQAPASKS